MPCNVDVPNSPTPWVIRFIRCVRLAVHFAWIGFGTALFYPFIGRQRREDLQRQWSHQILEILAIRLDAQRATLPQGCLIVANHISWLDIFVINAVCPAAFISKAEVRQWPFIGWLAARNNTVFLRRGSRGHARIVNAEIDALLNTDHDVAIFPEGTTTDGTHLLGFHAALLQPAIETGRPVLPLTLSYHDASGALSLAPSFAGETTLRQCFSAILACRSLVAKVSPSPAIETAGKARRELSSEAHAAIAAMLATKTGLPPANTSPEKPLDPQGE